MDLGVFSEGKEFISASQAARQIGYSSDYLGQLCRSKKIPGKLIGRTWYIDYDALVEYKTGQQLSKKNYNFPQKTESARTFENSVVKNSAESPEVKNLREAKLVYEEDLGPEFPQAVRRLAQINPTLPLQIAKQATATVIALLTVISGGVAVLEKVSPDLYQGFTATSESISSAGISTAKNLFGEVSTTQVVATSAFSIFSNSVEFLVDSFRNLRSIALGGKEDSVLPQTYKTNNVRTTLVKLQAEPTVPVVAEAPRQGSVSVASAQTDLQSQLEAYIRSEVSKSTQPSVVYNYSSPVTNLRQEILLADTRPTVTKQSDSDVSHLSSQIYDLTHGGRFYDPEITGATISGSQAQFTNLTFGSATGTSATTTSFFSDSALFTSASSTNFYADNANFGSISGTDINLTNLIFSAATGTNATTTNFFSTKGTFDDLYVNNYQQNDGTFAIISSVPTGDIFSVTDSSVTSGTLIHQSITANAGNGQTSYGQIIDLTDSTTAGGGYSAFSINVTGAGSGSGEKTLLSLDPGNHNKVVFDSDGSLRPTEDTASNTNSIGSASYYWKNGYFDTITANNLSGTVVSGSTSNDTWTIGSTEASDSYKAVVFQRNSGSGNALFQWDAGLGDLRFLSVNYPFNATYTVNDSSISTTANLYSGALTNNTTGGTQRLLSLSNTGTGTTEAGIYINNTGTGTTALEIDGTWTNGIVTNNNSIDAGSGNVSTTGTVSAGHIFATASSTLQDVTLANSTSTSATSTNLYSTNFNLGTGSISALSTGSATISDLTSGRIPFASTAGLLADSSALLWDNSLSQLTSTNLISTNSTSTNATSTNLYFSNSLSGPGNFTITSTGSVGVGSTNPTRTFDIVSATTHSATGEASQLSLRGPSSTTQKLNLAYDTTNNYGYIEAVNEGTQWLNLALQQSGGRVGIGTSQPNFTLHVNGDVQIGNNLYAATASTPSAIFSTNSSTKFNSFDLGGPGGAFVLNTANNLVTGNLLSLNNNDTQKFVVDYRGYVGIGGTINPAYPLEVYGTASTTALSTDSATITNLVSTNSTSTNATSTNLYASSSISIGTNSAQTGILRIPNNQYVYARNAANSADVGLIGYDASDVLQIQPTAVSFSGTGATVYMSSPTARLVVGTTGVSAFNSGEIGIQNNKYFASQTAAGSNTLGLIKGNSSDEVEIGGVNTTGIRLNKAAYILGNFTPNSSNTYTIGSSGTPFSTGYFGTSVSTPSLVTQSGAMTITPASGSNLDISLATSGDFTVNTSQLYIDTSAGYVGIGTTAPKQKLQVYGGELLVGNLTSDRGSQVQIRRESDGNALAISRAGSDVEALLVRLDGTTTPSIVSNNDDLKIGYGSTSAWSGGIIIKNSTGSVGIGTTNPQSPLDVLSTSSQLRLSYDSSHTSTFGVSSTGALTVTPQSGTNFNVNLATTGDFAVNTNQLYVDTSTGSVGIGTTSPGRETYAFSPSASLSFIKTAFNSGPSVEIGAATNLSDRYAGTLVFINDNNSGVSTATGRGIAAIQANTYTTDTNAGADSGGYLTFLTKPEASYWAERMRITPDGKVGIGTTNPSAPFEVKGSGTGATIAKFIDGNTTGCTLATGGTISCSSDSRLKKNIEDINYGLSDLMQLRPVVYNWNSESDSTTKNLGFIAQEVQAVIPKLVTTDDNGYLQLNTIGLVPVLAKSIQELNLKVEALSSATSTNEANFSVASIFDELWSMITAKLATAANGISDFFANRVRTKELCVADESGETCITKSALDMLIANAGQSSGVTTTTNSGGSGDNTDTGTDTNGDSGTDTGNESTDTGSTDTGTTDTGTDSGSTDTGTSDQGGEAVTTNDSGSTDSGTGDTVSTNTDSGGDTGAGGESL